MIDKLLWVMATQSNKDVIHGINIAIGHAENALETEREQIIEACDKVRQIEREVGLRQIDSCYSISGEQYYKDTYQNENK